MGWNQPCIIFAITVSNLPYGCQEHCICMSRCYIYTFWTIMMANNGHYLYMLINTKHLYIGKKTIVRLVYQMGNTVDSRLSLLGKNMKSCNNPSTINNQQSYHVKRHIVYIPNYVLLDVQTSEDSLNLKHWYQQSRAYMYSKYENPKYTLQYI